MAVDHEESLGEEIANALTHGLGAMLSITALVLMIVWSAFTHSPMKIVTVSIFGAMLVLMYTCSTIYHAHTNKKVKKVFKILDHSSIYLLIAGSYTPIVLIDLHGGWGWSLFGVIWGLALVGILAKIFYRNKGEILSSLIYIAMGWLCVVSVMPMIEHIPKGGLKLLLAGGLLYTGGVVFFLYEKLRFNHAIWHLFVLGGSICHFFAVFYSVIPFYYP